MPGDFNEATRVQMPALVHLTRLGYSYFGKISETQANSVYDPDTNILINIFKEKFSELNPDRAGEVEQVLRDIKNELDNDDLGQSFYNRLISVSPTKLIDFENPDNNVFHCTAEFTCKKDDEEFRPDITLFINGLPLVFIEVKKPNNIGGMVAESTRMNNERFPKRKFRRFINMFELMIFSNNMEYDTLDGIVPVQGAFYCTGAKNKAFFNVFREDNPLRDKVAPYNLNYPYLPIDPDVEKKILSDFNNQVIHNSPEYKTNLYFDTPTNRIITSMCSKERLLYILKYGICFVRSQKEVNGVIESREEKHIMRYQQLFASLKIKDKIDGGMRSGVVWHTQGSGKTALAYYLSNVLTDYFAKNNKVAKFYFIVDRLDLLEQAKMEFEARGLVVKTANSRRELMEQFRTNQSLEGTSGQREITVVNIQRFEEDREKVVLANYATNLQRIFIVDEAHRGYNPTGSFLANLFDADPNSIKIALTGTPLLNKERASWKVFGQYYHTYYYDKSIEDGYTLKIIREPIETSYKEKLSEIYESLETLVRRNDVQRADIIEHEKYVKELLRYIINDLKEFRIIQGDDTLGGMIICETSQQAKNLYAFFDEIQRELNGEASLKSNFKAGLILYDSDDKETRKRIISDFKYNYKIDFLIVFNMLLTGFDAPRLKRLYFGRKLQDHNLLQAITRVNRPYKDNKFGYIIDFADIKKSFDEVNAAYLDELNKFNNPSEIGDGLRSDALTQVIEDKDTLINNLRQLKQVLFNYTTDNAEIFSSEVSTIEEKEDLITLKKALVGIRDCFNLVKTFGDKDLKDRVSGFEIRKIPSLISEVQHCIDNINQKEALAHSTSMRQVINSALMNITFKFDKQNDEIMRIVSGEGEDIDQKWKRTILGFANNMDQDDSDFVTLREAFLRRFKEHGFVAQTMSEYERISKELDEVLKKLAELQRKNKVLLDKYNGDAKFARAHKRIKEENARRQTEGKPLLISQYDEEIINALNVIKEKIDKKVYDRNEILRQDAYFEQTVMVEVSEGLKSLGINNIREDRVFIQSRLASQYLNQYKDSYIA